jgi:hypothetical protein
MREREALLLLLLPVVVEDVILVTKLALVTPTGSALISGLKWFCTAFCAILLLHEKKQKDSFFLTLLLHSP